jgi:hypothetical protein
MIVCSLSSTAFLYDAAATAPRSALPGPEADGRMSKSKISVGMARVQQALGISTMPLIRRSILGM